MNRDHWLGIELRHFAALSAIAEERSFRGAANRLGYVQSAISRQIAFLEQMAGVRLIERSQGPRPVHLTDAGNLLLAHVNDILASIDAAKADLGDLEGGRAGDVRIGVFPGVPARVLPRALVAFGKSCPSAQVHATEAATDEPLFPLVQAGSIDLAFAHLPPAPGPFATCELLRVPWVLVVPAGSELARRGTAPTAMEMARLPLIGAKSPRLDPFIETRLRAENGDARVVFRSDVVETAQALAAAGLGVAVVPRLAVDEHDPRTAIIGLGDLLPPIGVGLVWHRNRRLEGPILEFRDTVRQLCAPAARGPARDGSRLERPTDITDHVSQARTARCAGGS